MIFNHEIAFLHVPKMAGMSITNYLLNNLPGEIHVIVPEASFDHARQAVKFEDVHGRLHLHVGERHERWAQAAALLARLGLSMNNFRKVLAVIRNPYSLERSHFQHLRKPMTQKWRMGDGGQELRIDSELALAGDFRRFCREAPFYGKLPSRIERYYTSDGRTLPVNLRLIRFESLEEDLMREVSGFGLDRSPLGHENSSSRSSAKSPTVDMSFDAGAEEAVFRKFHFLFNFYERSLDAEVRHADLATLQSGEQRLPSTEADQSAYVRSLYAAVLHRAPKEAELAHWMAEFGKDLDPLELPARLAASPEFARIGRKALGGPEADARFVDTVFRGMLRRAPREAERRRWLKALSQGLDPRRMPDRLMQSPELQRLPPTAEDDATHVRTLYAAVLRRAPKDAELTHWVNELGKGLNPLDLPARLAASAEFANSSLRGKASPEANARYVDALYRGLLQRDATELERTRWLAALDDGVDPRRLAEHLSRSPELARLRRQVLPDDASRRALAQSLVEAVLRRPAREPEIAQGARALAHGMDVPELLARLTGSNEYRQAKLKLVSPPPAAPVPPDTP